MLKMSVSGSHRVVCGVVGATGLIGRTLVQQVVKQAPALQDVLHASISIVGVTNSKRMMVAETGVSATEWQEQLTSNGEELDLRTFSQLLKKAATQQGQAATATAVLVDCTASDEVPAMYVELMQGGLHIVTPNKKFGAGPLSRYNQLKELSLTTGRCFMYEATVGAGLPVLCTLRSLLETGDKVLKVEGILSGTLSYIFNTYRPGAPFSSVVLDAKAKGYTEPDPREDLSGMDVARKVMILARECGLPLEAGALAVSSLVPEPLAQPNISVDEYLARLPEFDGEMAAKADAAHAAGKVIRYVGCVDVAAQTASVSLTEYPQDHAFAKLSGSDNMLVITTERYCSSPLVIRGPGAGAEVTAAGVFQDIIHVARWVARPPAA